MTSTAQRSACQLDIDHTLTSAKVLNGSMVSIACSFCTTVDGFVLQAGIDPYPDHALLINFEKVYAWRCSCAFEMGCPAVQRPRHSVTAYNVPTRPAKHAPLLCNTTGEIEGICRGSLTLLLDHLLPPDTLVPNSEIRHQQAVARGHSASSYLGRALSAGC